MSYFCPRIQRPFNTLNVPQYARNSRIFDASISDIFDFNRKRILNFNDFSIKYPNLNFNFYLSTYTLLRHILSNVNIPDTKPLSTTLQAFIKKTQKPASLDQNLNRHLTLTYSHTTPPYLTSITRMLT